MIDIFCQNMEITLIGFLLGLLLMLIPVYMIQACGARFLSKLAVAFVGMLVKCAALGAVLWLLQSWHSIAANVCAALLLMVVAGTASAALGLCACAQWHGGRCRGSGALLPVCGAGQQAAV